MKKLQIIILVFIQLNIFAQNNFLGIITNSQTKENLIFETHYFKNVIPGNSHQANLKTPDEKTWYIAVEFIALTPVPFSVATDEELY
jgi:hypothetical protein